jgi:hypothetical protein
VTSRLEQVKVGSSISQVLRLLMTIYATLSAQLRTFQETAVQERPVLRAAVRKNSRAKRSDPRVDAPMRDVLGLGVTGLDKIADAALIAARVVLYKWVLVCDCSEISDLLPYRHAD